MSRRNKDSERRLVHHSLRRHRMLRFERKRKTRFAATFVSVVNEKLGRKYARARVSFAFTRCTREKGWQNTLYAWKEEIRSKLLQYNLTTLKILPQYAINVPAFNSNNIGLANVQQFSSYILFYSLSRLINYTAVSYSRMLFDATSCGRVFSDSEDQLLRVF